MRLLSTIFAYAIDFSATAKNWSYNYFGIVFNRDGLNKLTDEPEMQKELASIPPPFWHPLCGGTLSTFTSPSVTATVDTPQQVNTFNVFHREFQKVDPY